MLSGCIESNSELKIDFHEWDEDIQELETSGLAEEVKALLARQARNVAKINRHLAKPSNTNTYKSVPDLVENAISEVKNFFAKKFLTLAHYEDKETLKIIQKDLLEKYSELQNKFIKKDVPDDKTYPHFLQLYQQLQGLDELNPFKDLLKAIAGRSDKYNAKCSLFISYAWPTKENEEKERHVQAFLVGLREHLKLAGILVYLDIKDNPAGNNINNFTENLRSFDFVLLIGTPSLTEKHRNGTHFVCNELNQIKKKRAEDVKKGRYNVLPVLLMGDMDSSIPIEYHGYTTIMTSWTGKSYLFNLKRLITQLYAVGPENQEYLELWKTFAKEIAAEHPEWVDDILNQPYHKEVSPDYKPASLTLFPAMPAPKATHPVETLMIKQIIKQLEKQSEKIQRLWLESLREQGLALLYLYADPAAEEINQAKNRVAEFAAVDASNRVLARKFETIPSLMENHDLQSLSKDFEDQRQLLELGSKVASALLCYKQRRYDDARQALEYFISKIPAIDSPLLSMEESHAILVNAHNLLAKIFRSTGDYAAAINCYEKALILSPDDPVLLSSQAALFNDMGKYKGEYSCHLKALELHNQAEKMIHLSIGSNERKSFVLTNLARGLQQLVEAKQIPAEEFASTLKRAEKILTQAIQLNPNNLTAYLFRGIVHMESLPSGPVFLEQALADFNFILAIQPEHPTALRRKGLVLIKQNELQTASEVFEQAEYCLQRKEWIPERKLWLEQIQQAQSFLKGEMDQRRSIYRPA